MPVLFPQEAAVLSVVDKTLKHAAALAASKIGLLWQELALPIQFDHNTYAGRKAEARCKLFLPHDHVPLKLQLALHACLRVRLASHLA